MKYFYIFSPVADGRVRPLANIIADEKNNTPADTITGNAFRNGKLCDARCKGYTL